MRASETSWQKTAALTIFKSPVSAFSDSTPGPTAPADGAQGSFCSDLTVLLTDHCPIDCIACGYRCIYNFITLTHSVRFSTHVICFRCSPVYTAGSSCLEIPTWSCLSKISMQQNRCNGENLKKHRSERLTITIHICYRNYVIQLPSKKMHWQLQI